MCVPCTGQSNDHRGLAGFLYYRASVIFEEGSNVPPGSPSVPLGGWYGWSCVSYALLGLFAAVYFDGPVFPGMRVEIASIRTEQVPRAPHAARAAASRTAARVSPRLMLCCCPRLAVP